MAGLAFCPDGQKTYFVRSVKATARREGLAWASPLFGKPLSCTAVLSRSKRRRWAGQCFASNSASSRPTAAGRRRRRRWSGRASTIDARCRVHQPKGLRSERSGGLKVEIGSAIYVERTELLLSEPFGSVFAIVADSQASTCRYDARQIMRCRSGKTHHAGPPKAPIAGHAGAGLIDHDGPFVSLSPRSTAVLAQMLRLTFPRQETRRWPRSQPHRFRRPPW